MKSKYLILGILVLTIVVAGCTYFYNSQNENLKEMMYSNPNEEIPKNLEVTEEIVDSILIYKDTGELIIEHYTMKDALEVAFLQPKYFTCKNNNKEPTLINYYDDSSDCSPEEGSGCGSSRWALICEDKFFVIESIHAARPTAYGPFNTPQKDLSQVETLYGYKVGNSQVITSTSFSNLDEESARITAEEAITISDETDYKFECLIFDSAEKRTDSRNGEEFWSVGFNCNDECSKIYINCGAAVMIKNNYEVIIGFPD